MSTDTVALGMIGTRGVTALLIQTSRTNIPMALFGRDVMRSRVRVRDVLPDRMKSMRHTGQKLRRGGSGNR